MKTDQLIQDIHAAIDELQQRAINDSMQDLNPDHWRGSIIAILDIKHKVSEITNEYLVREREQS